MPDPSPNADPPAEQGGAADSSPPVSIPPVWQALIPVAFLVAALALSIKKLGLPAHIPLVLSTAVAALPR